MAKGSSAPSQARLTNSYDDWEGKDAMRTLQSAHEIVSNPKLHAAARKHARKQMRGLKRVADAKPLSASRR